MYRINTNISKYREFKESKVLVLATKNNITSHMAQTFFIIYAITNEKTVNLMQNDKLLWAITTSSVETGSNKSGRYTLLKSYISWCRVLRTLTPDLCIRMEMDLSDWFPVNV